MVANHDDASHFSSAEKPHQNNRGLSVNALAGTPAEQRLIEQKWEEDEASRVENVICFYGDVQRRGDELEKMLRREQQRREQAELELRLLAEESKTKQAEQALERAALDKQLKQLRLEVDMWSRKEKGLNDWIKSQRQDWKKQKNQLEEDVKKAREEQICSRCGGAARRDAETQAECNYISSERVLLSDLSMCRQELVACRMQVDRLQQERTSFLKERSSLEDRIRRFEGGYQSSGCSVVVAMQDELTRLRERANTSLCPGQYAKLEAENEKLKKEVQQMSLEIDMRARERKNIRDSMRTIGKERSEFQRQKAEWINKETALEAEMEALANRVHVLENTLHQLLGLMEEKHDAAGGTAEEWELEMERLQICTVTTTQDFQAADIKDGQSNAFARDEPRKKKPSGKSKKPNLDSVLEAE